MSGHSKWKTIQHRKGKQDAVRSKEFAKLAKEIYIAAKSGGGQVESNASLRLAIDKAKTKSMPKDNIQRAIEKATGSSNNENYNELMYEGYGPAGVAIMVYCLTDNVNRTASSIRSIFNRRGGNLGTNGSVSYMFERKGNIVINCDENNIDGEDFGLSVMDFPIENVTIEDDIIHILTDVADFENVKMQIDQLNIIDSYVEAQITMVPNINVDIDDETAERVMALVEQLEDDDDVQEVYTNI